MAEKAKVLLRMDQDMHNTLKVIAANEKRSVNNIIVNLLEDYLESKRDETQLSIFKSVRNKMAHDEKTTDLKAEYINNNLTDFIFFIRNSRLMSMEEKINLLQEKGMLPRDINRKLGEEDVNRDEISTSNLNLDLDNTDDHDLVQKYLNMQNKNK